MLTVIQLTARALPRLDEDDRLERSLGWLSSVAEASDCFCAGASWSLVLSLAAGVSGSLAAGVSDSLAAGASPP